MKICMVLVNSFPPDIRVEKEARALLKNGHEVTLVSLLSGSLHSEEIYNEMQILRTRRKPSIRVRFDFVYNYMRRFLTSVIKEKQFDVIHVHDLACVSTCLNVGRRFEIPVVADLHENYPELKKDCNKKLSILKLPFRIITPVWRWKFHEKRVLQNVYKIITVIDEAKEHYVKDCDIPPEKITVLINTVDTETFKVNSESEPIENKYFKISYIGGFGPHRGIDTVIRAMPIIIKNAPDVKFMLVGGKGSKIYWNMIEKLIHEYNLENNIIVTGWIDFSKVPSYTAESNVCLIPHIKTGHTDTTIPHKLFQAMFLKKPVIVSNCKPLERIVNECNCGLVFPSGDHEKLAKAVLKLYNNRELARKLGENGRKATENKYNWDIEAKKLIALYEVIANDHNNSIAYKP